MLAVQQPVCSTYTFEKTMKLSLCLDMLLQTLVCFILERQAREKTTILQETVLWCLAHKSPDLHFFRFQAFSTLTTLSSVFVIWSTAKELLLSSQMSSCGRNNISAVQMFMCLKSFVTHLRVHIQFMLWVLTITEMQADPAHWRFSLISSCFQQAFCSDLSLLSLCVAHLYHYTCVFSTSAPLSFCHIMVQS